MSDRQPKLRSDLLVSQQETGGGISFVVKDPATGRYFRFGEAEHFIAQQLDGSTPVDIVRYRTEAQFASPVTTDTVEQFIEQFRRLGLLEREQTEFQQLRGKQRRFLGNPLYLRLKAFDPDRLLDRLVRKVRFCFTPYFLGFSAAVILFGVGMAAANGGEIGRDLVGLYSWETLLLAWVTILVVTTAHEFAHGLTCKHFGGQVHEMGFLLIYFQFAFYCNVSDAWLFPEKSKRLWVTFAGAYFELFLWGLATLTWRVTEPGTWFNSVALVVMATSAIKQFFNLNPLIKLDGYYLLSDYLEIPNLRQRAFSYLGSTIKGLWGSARQGSLDVTPRERRIFLTYGLLAGAYSYWLLSLIASRFGSFLVERYQGLGFILFTGFLIAIFQNPLRRALPKLPAVLQSGPGRIASMKRPAKVLLFLTAVLAILFLGRMELKVSGEFKVLPIHNADIRAEVEGLIEGIYVEEGDLVKQGDLIARLSDRDFIAELRKLEAELDEKRSKLKMLMAGPRREEIEVARKAVETAKTRQEQAWNRYEEAKRLHAEQLVKAEATVKKAQERLKYSRSYLDMFQSLFEEKAIARKQVEEAAEQVAVRAKELEEAQAELRLVLADDLTEVRRSLAVAEKELEEVKGKLKLLLAGSRPEEIEATEAEIARLQAQRRYLEDQLRLVGVVSPLTGIITTPKPKEKIGQLVKKGDLIVEVHELKTVTAEIAMSEKDVGDVKLGQKVALKARAYPEKSFFGTVTAIAPAAVKEENGWQGKVFRVTTEIDNPALLLKPEMTGNAKIFCGTRRIFDLMTRRLARYIRVEFWSWW